LEQVTLFNGDCMDFLKRMDSRSVDLVVTDPPYLIGTRGAGMYKQADKRYVNELEKIKDGFGESVLDELCRVMRKVNIYLFCSQKQILPLLDYFAVKRKCSWNIISWHKTNPVPACGNKYLTDTEFALFFREKGVRLNGSFGTKRTWYATPLNQSGKRLYGHPTVKPLEIVENFIVNSCPPGGSARPFHGKRNYRGSRPEARMRFCRLRDRCGVLRHGGEKNPWLARASKTAA
jgi:DNA modification methylase